MPNWRETSASCSTISGSERKRRTMMRRAALAGFAAALMMSAAGQMEIAKAQISGDTVKIGVLNDMSGPYADLGGQRAVEAARMAVADFGGNPPGKKNGVLSADHPNKPGVCGASSPPRDAQDRLAL